jgi:two-component system, cell cycle response regulator DivK
MDSIDSGTRLATILVVEDHEAQARVFERVLGKEHRVFIGRTAEDAIILGTQHPVDVVLMDLSLGGHLTGLDVMRELRKSDHYQQVPVIAVTAFASTRDGADLMMDGFNDFLPKPFTVSQLSATVAAALEWRQSRLQQLAKHASGEQAKFP